MAELSSAIIASGVAVVAGNSKKVQHPEGGIIAELLVDEGQAVTAGEKLVKIDDTTPRAALASMEKRIAQLLVRQARLEVERDGRSDFVTPGAITERINAEEIETLTNLERRLLEDRRSQNKGQKDRLAEQSLQLDAQIRGLDVQISAKSDEIRLIEKELSGKRQLLAAGAIPFTQVNNLDRNAVRLQGERHPYRRREQRSQNCSWR
jgi:HlyD family secretion protein